MADKIQENTGTEGEKVSKEHLEQARSGVKEVVRIRPDDSHLLVHASLTRNDKGGNTVPGVSSGPVTSVTSPSASAF